MFLTDVSVKKPVLMIMVILTTIIFGIVGYMSLPIDLMPNVEFPYVTVQTVYMGAGPEEIETSVIKPIEEQMTTVSNIKNLTSFCTEGVGFIILEFNLGVDPDLAAIDVKDKIDAILFKLPRDLQKPIIGKYDINSQPILNLALTGPQSAEVLRQMADKTVKEQLVRIGGVASISLAGGREREIQVNLHKDKMDGLGLSLQSIAGIIASQTANIPGGHVSGDRKEYTVRIQGQFEKIEQISDIRIPVMKGGSGNVMVPLSSIAEVEDTYKEARELARFNEQNTVGLAIQKRPDANTVKVSESILKEIDRINAELPQGTKINIAQDRSKFIKDSVKDMYNNMFIGMLLTAAMLFLFLGDIIVTIIAAVTLPASVIITFWGMQLFGFSLNMMTLMAIAISIGTLVTNAIIVLENIVRHRDTGMPIREASVVGTNEVLVAVVASALTNIAVFLPMANMKGITGEFFKSLGLTIVVATVASLFLSFTLTPLMASRLLKSKQIGDKKSKAHFLDKPLTALQKAYVLSLRKAIQYKWVVIILTGVAFFGSFFLAKQLGTEFFPQGDQGTLSINIEMPYGTSMEETNRALKVVESRITTIPELKSVYSSLGGSGTESGVNFGSLLVRLKDKKERTRSTVDVVNEMRPFLADIPDAKIVIKEAQSMGGGGTSADINVEVTGDNMAEILRLADSVKTLAQTVPGLVDVQLSWKAAKPEIKFIPDRMMLDEYGTNVASIGMNLRNCLSGNEAAVFREDNDEFKIRVQYAEKDRSSIEAIENITMPTSKGIVPLKALSKVVNEGGAANVNRKNRQRLVTVTANVANGAAGTKAAELKKLTDKIPISSGYKIYYGGQAERMRESFSQLALAALLAILLTYMVLAASIESLTQPFLVMVTIPLGLIGVFLALYITGRTISMLSIMSLVMLIGVVVNNAILIIDYAHQRQRAGLSKHDAILESCGVKFNAILMMNLAVVLASLPQALAVSSMQSPFAITAIGGVIVSTILTLYAVPSMYLATSRRGGN